MNYRDWKAGDKVVCVDPGPVCSQAGKVDPSGLNEGRIYEIGSVTVAWSHYKGEVGYHVGILVAGVENPQSATSGFNARRFRKVEPRKTDISIFTAMLDRTKVDA